MQLTCPMCGFHTAIETFAADTDARHFAALMGKVPPPLSDLVLKYVSMFAPPKHKMTFGRGRRVLEPLVAMIAVGRVSRARREWPVGLEMWERALQSMSEKRAELTLPLRSHGYLLEVVSGYADKLEARAEAEDMAQLRTGKRAAEPDPLSAAGWDAERKQQHERSKAVALATGAMKSAQKLGVPHTAQTLAGELVAGGIGRAAAEFVAGKLFKPKTKT